MKAGKITEFFKTIKYCLLFSWETSAVYTIFRVISSILPSMLTIILSYIGKDILDTFTKESSEIYRNRFLQLMGLFLLINVVIALMRNVTQYIQSVHSDILNAKLSQNILHKSLNADLEYFDNAEYHDALVLATGNIYAVTEMVWQTVQAISNGITAIGVFCILCSQNWMYGVLTAAASIPSAAASIRYTKEIYQLDVEQINNERKKSYIQAIATEKEYAASLRLYDTADLLTARYRQLWKMTFDRKKKTLCSRSLVTGVLNCLPEVVTVLVGADIGFDIFAGKLTISFYSLYTGLVSQLWSNLYILTNSVIAIYDNQLKIQSVQKLDSYENHIKDTGKKELKRVGMITFKNVCFSYPETGISVLKNVSFTINDGEKIALIGLNGSGKSTVIKLLLRFYEPDSGMIMINGENIRSYSLKSLRENFAVYFQEEPNYSFSLKENVTISDPQQKGNNRDQKINSLLEKFAPDVLKKASAGLDTEIMRLLSSDGMELSGGQHQKIALSRTFYRKHTALILDEPSASLDPEAEHQLFSVLEKEAKGKTTLYVSHRLSNVRLADRIIVLENGKVIESGNHEELLQKNSRYKQLLQYQNKRFTGEKHGSCLN